MLRSTLRFARLRWPSILVGTVLLGAFTAGFLTSPSAALKGPHTSDRPVSLVVTKLMDEQHLSKHAMDDEISGRGLIEFITTLDPMKLYFYKSDVDEFMKKKDELDDMIKKGDVSFGYTIFNRFLERVNERVDVVGEILEQPINLEDHEEMVIDRDQRRFPHTKEEARELWRKRLEYEILVLKGDKTEGKEAIEKLNRRYDSYRKRMEQFDRDDLLEMYLTAITTSFDPHTTYMSPSTLENFRIAMKLKLEGIGAALRSTDGQTVVSKIIPGGAADKHGKLQAEDRIVSVGQGEEGEMVDIVDMKLNDVVKKIRGDAGTIVRLGVVPNGKVETKVYNITRAKIELKDSEARGEIIEEGAKLDGSKLKVGVIDLPSFYMDMEGARAGIANYKSTTRDVRKLLDDFNEKKVDIVVLDLRRNGGGSLNEAISLTGLFIDRGPVVQVKDSADRVQAYNDLERGMAWDGPLIVLTSKFSASASEILAGAIQDYNRGLVVGDSTTHGKGTVQSLLDVGEQLFRIPNPPNYGALKITMQQFYRPSGDSTQKLGVKSDLVLPALSDYLEGISEADLDYAIDFDRVDAAPFSKTNMVSSELVKNLREMSKTRVDASDDFKKVQRDIEKYVDQKKRKTVSLNEKEFFARRAELDADKAEEEEFEEKDADVVVKRDYYFNEILSISRDYVNALEKNKVAQN